MGGTARGIGEISPGFHYNPCVGTAIGGRCVAGFYDGSGERLMLVQAKAQGYVERTFDAVDANFAVALCRVPVAATEERARVIDGKIEYRAGAEFAYIEVTAEGPGRTRAE